MSITTCLRLVDFALSGVGLLAWPVIALGYPLFASIRAVENDSKNQMRKLVIYWTLFSLFSLFEFAFVKIIEWVPFWSSLRLVLIFWLVMPQFGGAYLAYQDFVRPVLLVKLQAVIDTFYKLKERPCKRKTFLDVVEKYIEENGTEALEKLIVLEHESQKYIDFQRDAKMIESEGGNPAATSKQIYYEQPNSSARVLSGTDIVTNVEEMAPPEASTENSPPETPPLKKTQKEWTCDLCKVTAVSEAIINAHLQGRKHKSKLESLKASLLDAKNAQPSTLHESQKCIDFQRDAKMIESEGGNPAATSKQIHYEQPNSSARVLSGTDIVTNVEEMAPPEASSENSPPETPPLKKTQKEWTCDLCKVTAVSEAIINAHLQGRKHKSKLESLKASLLDAKNAQPSTLRTNCGDGTNVEEMAPPEASTENSPPETPPLKKTQKEWTCDLCKVIAVSEAIINAHLQGRKHKSKLESLKASLLDAKNAQPSTLHESQKYIDFQRDAKMIESEGGNPAATSKQIYYEQPNSSARVLSGTDIVTNVEEMAPPEASTENSPPETPPLKKTQKEWTCDLCKVTAVSEAIINAHLQGRKHKSKLESLKASLLDAKNAQPSTLHESQKCIDFQRDAKMIESEGGNPAATSKQIHYEQPNSSARVLSGTDIVTNVEEMAPPEASSENSPPETPPLKKTQKEWTCDLCKVTAVSEAIINAHLQGRKHKSKLESLKASLLDAKNAQPSTLRTNCGDGTNVEEMAPPEASTENSPPETPPLKKTQKEWTCDLCKVTAVSEAIINAHLQGRKHKSKLESLKASLLDAKNAQPSTLHESQKYIDFQRDAKMIESEGGNPAATSKQIYYEQPNSSARVLSGTDIVTNVEEMAPPEASTENSPPETPPLKKTQKEWTCDLCKVTAVSEAIINAHLQGRKHKSKLESLKASLLDAKNAQPSTLHESQKYIDFQRDAKMIESEGGNPAATSKQIYYEQPNSSARVLSGTDIVTNVEEMAPPEASTENSPPETPPLKKTQKEWTCDLCKVTAVSEAIINAHLQGRKHKSKLESLKASLLDAKNAQPSTLHESQKYIDFQRDAKMIESEGGNPAATSKQIYYEQPNSSARVLSGTDIVTNVEEMAPPEASTENSPPETPPLKKTQKEWTCDLCKVTAVSEAIINAHLQGRKHKSKLESLKASLLDAKNAQPSTLHESQKYIDFQRDAKMIESEGGNPAATSKQIHYEQPNSSARVLSGTDIVTNVEEMAPPEASTENSPPETPPLKQTQKEWTCDLCKVTAVSEAIINAHLQGRKHKSKLEFLKVSLLDAKNAQSSTLQRQVRHTLSVSAAWYPKETYAASEIKELMSSNDTAEKRCPEALPLKKPHQEWKCDLCKVTTTSNQDLNAHLRGSKHKSTLETLRAGTLSAQHTGSSPSGTSNLNHGNAAEKFIKESGSELEKLTTSKAQTGCGACSNSQSDIQVVESKDKNSSSASQQVQYVQSVNAVCIKAKEMTPPEGTDVNIEAKEMTPPEARRADIPTLKKVQQELTGALTTRKLHTKVNQGYPVGTEIKTDIFKHRCLVCDVKLLSDIDVASHLKGKLHKFNIQKVEKHEARIT